jgi:lipoprotein-releasing system ATP-binding protein
MNNIEFILEAQNIFKSYNNDEKKIEVLKSVSLKIKRGKISVIIGASGAGKSTLLHILSGLDRSDGGSVLYQGQNILELSSDKLSSFRNRHFGFVFQFHHLLPEFTAEENIAIPQMIAGVSLSEAKSKSNELLNTVGLSDRKTHKPAELSGGEQQRIAIARALANEPELIFADEPTGNLDSVNADALNKLFIELRDKFNKTFVIVTHNPELVKLADEVFEMKDGVLVTGQ